MNIGKSIGKVLVANRGEIAMRILRGLKQLAVPSAVLYHPVERHSPMLALADEAIALAGDSPVAAYLDIPGIVELCRRHGIDAVHPGYGFLAESAAFARALEDAGITFVGPKPEVITLMGDKIASRDFVRSRGFPVAPSVMDDGDDAALIAGIEAIDFPVVVKASAGGGGKGMRIVYSSAELPEVLRSVRSEAQRYFGDDRIYAERFVEDPRHIEVQVLGDGHGNCIHLGERECSVQRRFQKIIEEAPSPVLNDEQRASICEVAVGIAKATHYTGAGTVEFIYAPDGEFYFLEMNTRIQVEHPVTEMVTGVDIVAEQLRVAAGEPLSVGQSDIVLSGHAIECRICAEVPEDDFAPAAGEVLMLRQPAGERVRFDHGCWEGQQVGTAFDSMLAKLIVHADNRNDAIACMLQALEDLVLLGVSTNSAYLQRIFQHPAFCSGDTTTAFVARHADALRPAPPTEQSRAAALALTALGDPVFVQLMQEVPQPYRLMNEWRN